MGRRHTGRRTYERIAVRLPPRLAALIDTLLPDIVISGWTGPLNGQVKRQRMVVDVVKAVPFTAVVETGTYRGATTAFLQETTHLPVFTVEIHPRFYNYSRLRFRREPEITVVEGDSRSYLAELAMDRSFPRDRVLFYLDAHWNVADQSAEPPLLEELRTIAQHWTESVVIVDDFAVPDDPQYGFDVYGPGVELSTEFVSPEEIGSPNLFWPAAPGLEETGARRGCVIFAYGKDVTARLARLTSLRRT